MPQETFLSTLPTTQQSVPTLVPTEKHTKPEGSALPSTSAPPLKFGPDEDGFHRELRQRVARYFETTGRRQRDCPQMYIKTLVILGWVAVSYGLLVFGNVTWWMAVPLAISTGLAMAAVGFNIQHDANHHGYSDRRWVNKIMSLTLDLIGGSSYIWARKHNAIHHSYTNIAGHDNDLDIGFIGRLSPDQRWLPFHRLQHFYLWLLYGFLPIKWQLFDDYRDVVTGKIGGGHRFARPKGWDLVILIGGKLAFYTFAFVIPMIFHPVWAVLALYAIASLFQGMVLSVVFQLAHAVEEAAFPAPPPDSSRMDSPWAVHQIETTVNFARNNRLLSWFVGGLNFQVEHHLFPQICHIHYPALSRVVEETCKEFKLRYLAHRTFLSGIASHFRWLRQMGRPALV